MIVGAVPLVPPAIDENFETVLAWADDVRRLRVRANADTPADAAKAREFGAEGIGLCRTEHMFMAPDRLPVVQEMILAEDERSRRAALDLLLPVQQGDFEAIFEAMAGYPVTIRLLDPPLHEFLPSAEEATSEAMRRRIEQLREANPMLGTRGCRLGLQWPEIYEMQVRAIVRAARAVAERTGEAPLVEIMHPLVGFAEELRRLRELTERVAAEEPDVEYSCGTMIELPRACVRADEIAEIADFCSFGTNDLTQTTLGFSRDDAEGKFLTYYLEHGVLARNPFEVLDREGVGDLMRIAVERGRGVKPELKLGICGEHGGEPRSVAFCHELGLDYVSCSPYRVPLARLAAAQAALADAGRHLGRRRRLTRQLRVLASLETTLRERMAHYAVPGVALALIADSEIAAEAAYGVKEAGGGDPVTPVTRFQACSISKPVAVLGMLRLVEQGVVDLDADVNDMLTSWRVPPNASWQPRVTLRQIASHSAGLTVGGFPGYARGGPLPTLTEILTGSAPANTAGIRVDTLPGVEFRYAGGGTMVLQQVLEDATGRPFAELMRELVLEPLGMSRSGYTQPLPDELHGRGGDRARCGRHAGRGRVARLPGARRRRPLDDARRPRALRHRRAARGRGRSRRDPRARRSRRRCSPATRVRRSRLGGLDSVGLGLFLGGPMVRAQRRQRGLPVPPDRTPRRGLRARGDDERRPGARARRGDPGRGRARDGLARLGGVPAGRRTTGRRSRSTLIGAYEVRPGVVIEVARDGDELAARRCPGSRRSGSSGCSESDFGSFSVETTVAFDDGDLILRQNDGELRCRRVDRYT